jgi:large subunit ribosomal protein L29
MKVSEIRDLSTDALTTRLSDAQEELMKLRFQQSTGELTDTSRVREIRHNIARMLTVLNERSRSESGTEGAK